MAEAAVEVKPWAGIWLAEDIELLVAGVKSNSWVDASLGAIGATLDGLAFVSDPASSLLQYGLSWLLEQVAPLREALDWLAGDAAQIAAHAATWRNIATDVRASVATLDTHVRVDVAGWGGTAGPAYRAWAGEQRGALSALAQAADAMAVITEAAGFVVAAVRAMVRDAIAVVVSRAIVYATEEAFSFGLATPLVVEQVSTLVAAWSAKITKWLRGLIASLTNLMPAVRHLNTLIDKIEQLLARRAGSPSLLREGEGIVRNGKKILMTMDNVRSVATKYGLDVRDVPIRIDKVRAGAAPGEEIFGITHPDGSVTLTRDAFMNEEELARTLAHELFHVEDLRKGLPMPYSQRATRKWENRAEAYEEQWWQQHKHLLDS